MRKFFITDIHGDYHGFKLLLRHAEVDLSRDQLVIGGDMIDRGKDSAKVVREVKALMDKYPNNVHAVIGNHEEMMGWFYQRSDRLWLNHGGHDTLHNFIEMFPEEEIRQIFIDWVVSLPLFFEDDEYFYAHAGLNPDKPLESQSREILWMTENDFYSMPKDSLLTLTCGKPVIHGHTPVEYIYFDGARINCDMGSGSYRIKEERGIGIVNLSEMVYLVYKPIKKKIEKRRIMRFD